MKGKNQHHPPRKTTSKQHKAAVELASQRRQLAKVLKREGVNPSDIFEKKQAQELPPPSDNEPESKDQPLPPPSPEVFVRRESDRQMKIAQRRKRAKLLTKRTVKGQPFMKSIINDLVAKLEK